MGFMAWNTFVVRVEHPYIVRKSEKPLGMGGLTFPCRENCMLTIAAGNQSTCLALARQTTL